MAQNKCGPLAVAGGRPGLRHHGAAHGDARRRRAGFSMFGWRRIAAGRHDPDVSIDERLSFGAVAETDRQVLTNYEIRALRIRTWRNEGLAKFLKGNDA